MSITTINHHPQHVALDHALSTPKDAAIAQEAALERKHMATVVQQKELMSHQALENAVKEINDFIAPTLQSIRFSIDQESERLVVKIIDTATQEVLRQIPSEEALRVAKTFDHLRGLIVSLKI